MERTILHSDMNCFYASVEMMLNPSLKGKPIAVCGATEDRHGIVLAKSELAKRAGVKTGMVNWEAQRVCPDLILVPPQYDQYIKYSKLAHQIYYRYTDIVEPFGMDECWLDVTESTDIFGDGMAIAEQIRRSVKQELGLTVSIGVSFNKIFAKLGSDMKKPDAITQITSDNYKEKIWKLPASDLLYCGRATTAKLGSYAIRTISDIAKSPPSMLKSILGVNGIALWNYANGTDGSRVAHKDFVPPLKSIGHGITCVADLENASEVWRVILELSQDIGHRLRIHELSALGVRVYIRGNDLNGVQYQTKLANKTQFSNVIAEKAFELFRQKYDWKTPVRQVTVTATDLVSKHTPSQLTFFTDTGREEKSERLETALEKLRERFGKKAVTYCTLLCDKKMPCDGRDKVRMPGLMYK